MGGYDRVFSRFLRVLLISAGRRRIGEAFALVLATGLTEGIGLALLVPLLETLDGGAARPAGASAIVSQVAARLGLEPLLAVFVSAFFVIVIVRAWLVRRRDILQTEIRLGFASAIRVGLYRAIAEARWPFLARSRGADLSSALLSEIDRVNQGMSYALQLPARAVLFAVHLAVAFWIAPALSAVAAAAGLGLAWAVGRRMPRTVRLGRALAESNRAMHREIGEFLAGIKMAKIQRAEARHVAAFGAMIAATRRTMIAFARSTADARLVQEAAGAALIGATLLAGVDLIHLPLARLLLFVLIFYRLVPMTQEMQQSVQQALHLLPAFESVMDATEACRVEAEPACAPAAPLLLSREIRLEGVRFAHDGGAGEVLRGIDLTIPAFRLTILSGPSGIGKSTLLDLLSGLLEPTVGRVLIDGCLLTASTAPAWRESIAYVPQENFLFHDTVRANLLWARPDADEAELVEALRQAAAGFVFELPDGLETVIGDRGVRLSGGERQRLALARALLRRPTLLLLDEATNALDVDNERLVLDSVDRLRGSVTVVMATHRVPRHIAVDQMVTLVDGRIRSTPAIAAQGAR